MQEEASGPLSIPAVTLISAPCQLVFWSYISILKVSQTIMIMAKVVWVILLNAACIVQASDQFTPRRITSELQYEFTVAVRHNTNKNDNFNEEAQLQSLQDR